MCITTNNLSVGYGQRAVLSELNLHFNEGEMVALLGRNGGGKSTLLRTLAGLQTPVSGSYEAPEVAVVLTQLDVMSGTSVRDVVALGRYRHTNFLGGLSGEDERIIAESLVRVGYHGRQDHPFLELSDGEKQRILIAKALAQQTQAILLDEPTSHLDIPGRVQVFSLLRELAEQEGKTIIIATHELDLAQQYAHRLVALDDILESAKCIRHNAKYISKTDWAEIDGYRFYYAVEGPEDGEPVLLLHGNGGNHSKLEATHRQLAQAGYLVYAMDSRGQGANAEQEEYHYAEMAEDCYRFIECIVESGECKVDDGKRKEKPIVFGWSDGGILGLMLEIAHPGTCRALIVSGANISCHNYLAPNDYMEPDPEETMTAEEYQQYLGELPPLERMMRLEPEISEAELATIACPTLVVAGENDIILREHTERIAHAIPGAELCIVPGHDHGSHIKYNPLIGEIILRFIQR